MEQNNNLKSYFSFINIFILLLFAVVVGVISSLTTYSLLSPKLFNQLPSETQLPIIPQTQPNVLPTTTVVLPTSSAVDETAGWKTYRNKRYGFEFQYPAGEFLVDSNLPTILRIQEQNNLVKIVYNVYPDFESGWEIRIYQNNSKRELRDWFNSTFDKKANIDCHETESNIKIKNTYTLLFSKNSMDERCDNGGYYTISPNKSTIVQWGLGNDIARGFDEIKSTFKFTE